MKVIIIASGKGGTGKTSLTAGVSSAIAILKRKVLVIDGDIGLRNLDIALGMSDKVVFSFKDVSNGIVPLCRAIVEHPKIKNLWLLTAPSDSVGLTEGGLKNLKYQAREQGFDYILFDCPAGIGKELEQFSKIADQAIIISTPENACLRGAEKVARLVEDRGVRTTRLVVNRVRKNLIKEGFASNIDTAMDITGLPLLGVIPEDEDVIVCSNKGKMIIKAKKDGASKAYFNIAKRLDGRKLVLMKM